MIGEIHNLNVAFSTIDVKLKKLERLEKSLSSEICANNEQISSVNNKYETELKSLHEQLDNSFSYVDTRMDLIFLAKAKEIDEHFDTIFTHVDNEVKCVNAWMPELEKSSSSCFRSEAESLVSKKVLDLKFSSFKEDLLPHCH